MSAIRIAGVLTLGLVLAGTPAYAQSGGSSGVIHGVVTDESGGKLPGVIATLTSPAMQVKQMIAVATRRQLQLRRAAGGRLSDRLRAAGLHARSIRDDLRLPVGFAAKVDVVMKVGGLEEPVTVSGGSRR